jgi:CubicO group peptidase (beta-lactamase class C family)
MKVKPLRRLSLALASFALLAPPALGQPAHDPFGDISEITIRHLMTHSAGFRNPTWIWRDDSKDWQPFEPPGWSQLVAMMPYTEVLFKPGSRFSYSNPGVIYLGRIVELLTHDDYEVYTDKNIFNRCIHHATPLDLTDRAVCRWADITAFPRGSREPVAAGLARLQQGV